MVNDFFPTRSCCTYIHFNLERVARVTWVTSVPISVFQELSVLELDTMYVTDIQTTDMHDCLMPPTKGRGTIMKAVNRVITGIRGVLLLVGKRLFPTMS